MNATIKLLLFLFEFYNFEFGLYDEMKIKIYSSSSFNISNKL